MGCCPVNNFSKPRLSSYFFGASSALALAFMLSASAVPRAQTAEATVGCNKDAIQAVAPKDTTITSAGMADQPILNCTVEGYVTTTNPGPNRSNFRVNLPDRNLWSHRFYFMGLGGAAGSTPPAPPHILGSGFVVAVTDTGHQGNGLDWSFMSDKAKALDHVHRGAHVTTVAAQQITKAYYGGEKFYRYHVGCSGGGRMGTEAIRNHPEDYDGVLIGGNGMVNESGNAAGPMLKFMLTSQLQNMPGGWVSRAKLKMVEDHVTAACDDSDGAHDGVVWDSRLCHYDVAKLRCVAGDKPNCLTDPEIATIKGSIRGPHSLTGQKIAEGMPITNMSMWQFNGAEPPPWKPIATPENLRTASSAYVITSTMAAGLISKDYDVLKDMDFSDAAIHQWGQAFSALSMPSVPKDLVGFEKAGGKFILWSGTSDPCCSYIEQENAYNSALHEFGAARVNRFFALYPVPGMGHCGGGTGPTDSTDLMFQSLIDWVEKGKTPGKIVAHRGARAQMPFKMLTTTAEAGVPISPYSGDSRDFLMCRYPLVSVFDKTKAKIPDAVYDARNWSCKPRRL